MISQIAGILALIVAAAVAIATPLACSAPSAPSEKRLVVSLSRSICFGTCPDYEVSLYDDGTLVYEGRRFVNVVGHKTKTRDSDIVARVRKAILDAGIQKLDKHCCDCQEWTDHPTVIVGFDADGEWKTLEDYHGCTKAPASLRTLEGTLDELLGTAEFVGKQK
jgi:hypothetical protein